MINLSGYRIPIVIAAIVVSIIGIAAAQSLSPPSTMETIDLSQLDVALTHIKEINTRIGVEAKPYVDRIHELSEKYHFSFEKGDSVDIATGTIRRVPSNLSNNQPPAQLKR